MNYHLVTQISQFTPFSALMLLVRCREGHPACTGTCSTNPRGLLLKDPALTGQLNKNQ